MRTIFSSVIFVFRRAALLLSLAVIVGNGGSAVAAGIAWHPDLDTARSAARSSGKPVLAVFDAAWLDGRPAADVLAGPEAAAVVAACFEPVRLDVDAHGDLVRRLEIQHVPTACVLGPENQLLASFECPDTPAAFVAAAARAAQIAATGSGPTADQPALTGSGDAFGQQFATGATEAAAAEAVADKVRRLASFAGGQAAAPTFRSAAAAPLQPDVVATSSAPFTPTNPEIAPSLDPAPPAWPAEQTSVSAFAPPASPAVPRPDIEPAAQAGPWLAAKPADPAATAEQPANGTAEPAKPTNAFLAALQRPFSIFSRPATPPPPTLPPARPQSPAEVVAAAAGEAGPQQPMPLGLEGYCPVTLAERGSWVEGRPQWGARHRGRTYLFAGPEQQQAFLADPDRYAPALSGDDPVLAFESGRSEPGRRAYGVTYQARMYLFSTPETRAAFSADPGRYTSRVMIAEGRGPADAVRRF